jgi:two-component system chemotaxis response regulator CheB
LAIRALIVDDSAFMRKVLADMLNSDSDIEVIDTARDGEDALKKVKELNPDVVLLDVEMPKMDGLTALAYIMAEHPTPAVMLSAMDKREADVVIKSFEHGAIDFIPKPSGVIFLDIESIKEEILSKVKMAAGIEVERIEFSLPEIKFVKPAPKPKLAKKEVVAIGASTGGPQALTQILSHLPGNIPVGLLIVQHMPSIFTSSLAEHLAWQCSIRVKEAKDGEVVSPGLALIAPGDYHMIVEKSDEERVKLIQTPKVNGVRPSIDIMMKSAAEVYGEKVLGVILTGMGSDGAAGMKAIKERGGETIVEDKSSCVVFGMPKATIDLGCADKVVPLSEIPKEIIKMI